VRSCFVKLLREAKVWETDADAEAEAEAAVEPVGKVAGARKATADDVKWHDEEGGDIALGGELHTVDGRGRVRGCERKCVTHCVALGLVML
jgi:hypothetical protein